MALVVESENTQTAVVGTLHILASPTTNRSRIFRVDLGAMLAGDTVELRMKTAVRAGGTEREQQNVTYANIMGSPIVESIPISSDLGASFTLTQTTGTARTYPWKVLTIGNTPLVVESENTLTTVISTVHTLGTATTTNKMRVLRADLGAMIAGDIVSIRVLTAVRTGGTIREQQNATYANVVGSPIFESVPISSDVGATFTITQTAGVSRQIPWKVLTFPE